MLNGGGYESFLGLDVIFVLLSSQLPSRFLVILLLDRFLNSQVVSHFGKGGPKLFLQMVDFAGLNGFAIFIAPLGLKKKPFNVAQFV